MDNTDALSKIKEMQQKIKDQIKIFVISPTTAKELSEADLSASQNVLFFLSEYMPDNVTYLVKGGLRNTFLDLHEAKFIELYTFDDLKNKFKKD